MLTVHTTLKVASNAKYDALANILKQSDLRFFIVFHFDSVEKCHSF